MQLFGGPENTALEERVRREVAEGPSRLVRTLDWLEDYFWPFRLFGMITIAVAGLYLFVIHTLSGGPRVGGRSLWGLWPCVAFLALMGIGLCFRQRWAAGLFAAFLILFATGMAAYAAFYAPFSVFLLNLPVLAVFAWPAIIVLLNWGKFRERRKER